MEAAAASVAEFPPSRISVARRMEEVEIEVRELFEMQPRRLSNLTPRSFADYLAEHMQGDGLDDDLKEEIMGVRRVDGADEQVGGGGARCQARPDGHHFEAPSQ